MTRLRVLLLLVFGAVPFFAQTDPPSRVARLGYLDGSVSFQPAGIDDWEPANPNRPMTTGDQIWVDQDSHAEMHVGSTAFRLGSQTAFQFLNLDDQTEQISLSTGTLNLHVRYLDENQIIEVDTPNLAVSVLRPGDYRIDAQPDSQTTVVTIRDGQVEGTGGGQAFNLGRGQQAVVNGDQSSIGYNVYMAPDMDEWDSWCSDRENREEHSPALRYVPAEMTGYADLDDHGDWQSSPYGEVWIPRDAPDGWAPYHDGHWAWIDPWGWTWVDDAAWGFAPFHYGRWAYWQNRWAWIPGPMAVRPVYAPAMVAWIGGDRFGVALSFGSPSIAWVPLGPREVYAPPYTVSQAYITRVNNSNTVINNVNVTNVYNVTNVTYVNMRAPNAVVAMPAQAMASAQPVKNVARPVPAAALASAQVVRNAAVAPQRAAVIGRSSPPANVVRPPAAVVNRPVVAKTPPPPAPPAFAARQQALQRNPGTPLTYQNLQQIRQAAPPPRQAVVVKQAPAAQVVQPKVSAQPPPPRNTMMQSRPGAPPSGTPQQVSRPNTPVYRQPPPANAAQPVYHAPAPVNQPAPTQQQPAYKPPTPPNREVEPVKPVNAAPPPQPAYRPPPREVEPVKPVNEAQPQQPAYRPPPDREAVEPAKPVNAAPPPVRPAPPAAVTKSTAPPPKKKPPEKSTDKEEK